MSARLYIGSLNTETTAESLGKLFEQQGPVIEAIIVAHGEKSTGYAFVTMQDPETAQKALQALNGYELEGSKIRVEIARSKGPRTRRPPNSVPLSQRPVVPDRIYIRNLPFSMTDDQLKGLFKEYDVAEATAVRNPRGRASGYGFITCKTPEQAQAILQAHPTMEAGGRTLRLAQAHEPAPRAQRPSRRPRPRRNQDGQFASGRRPTRPRMQRRPRNPHYVPSSQRPILPGCLHIRNLPFSMTDAQLKDLFNGYQISSATAVHNPRGRPSGYGFVTFKNVDDAAKFLQEHRTMEAGGRTLRLDQAHQPMPRAQQDSQAPPTKTQ